MNHKDPSAGFGATPNNVLRLAEWGITARIDVGEILIDTSGKSVLAALLDIRRQTHTLFSQMRLERRHSAVTVSKKNSYTWDSQIYLQITSGYFLPTIWRFVTRRAA